MDDQQDENNFFADELSDIFENAPGALHLIGPDGIVSRANKCQLEMLGFDRAEFVGSHISEYYCSSVEFEKLFNQLKDDQVISNYEVQLKSKNGPPRNTLISANVRLHNGKPVYSRFFVQEITEQKTAALLAMENRLREALEKNEFVVYYQPQVSIQTGQILGIEALLRWKDANGQTILPDQFIPLAEASGLIEPIGEWVLKEACKQVKLWHQMGFKNLIVAVNLSVKQLLHKNLAANIKKILNDAKLESKFLELEITESQIIQNPKMILQAVLELKNLGIKFALDDFSTGYSSLSHIKNFPADIIKIDRTFVHGLPDHVENKAIARSIISLGHSLGMIVVAEGVETMEQLKFFYKEGCNKAQGYLFNNAVPAESLTAILQEDPYWGIINKIKKYQPPSSSKLHRNLGNNRF